MKPSELELLKKGDTLYRVNADGKVETATFERISTGREPETLLHVKYDGKLGHKAVCSFGFFSRTKAEALHIYLRQCKDAIPAHEASVTALQDLIEKLKKEVERVERVLGME